MQQKALYIFIFQKLIIKKDNMEKVRLIQWPSAWTESFEKYGPVCNDDYEVIWDRDEWELFVKEFDPYLEDFIFEFYEDDE